MLKRILFGGGERNTLSTDISLLLFRITCGLPLMTVFEKLFPRDGRWGPQEWFITDVAEMGFPLPLFFAWCAVLSEVVGGLLILLGLGTRPASIFVAITTFVAAFIYHDMDLVGKGLLATIFLFLATSLLISGAGRFSLDRLINRETRIDTNSV